MSQFTAEKTLGKKDIEFELFSIAGEPFLRIDGNKVELDSLGDSTCSNKY